MRDPAHVTIDARMLPLSGIGTYIREVVPRVVARWRGARFTLLGHIESLRTLVPSDRANHVRCTAPIYSIAEQVSVLRAIPGDATLFWAPHYNVPLLYRGRMAVTVHDVNHLALPQGSLPRRVYARTLFAAVRRKAALVMFDSEFTRSEFERRVGTPARAQVVTLGVAEPWFHLAEPTVSETPFFLYVGNVKPHKNLPRLLEAFGMVAAHLPHRLVIVGRRDGLLTADRDAERLATALGDRVEFTGHLEHADLEKRVAACDALVLPSLYEGFGLPPLEALAAGRAVAVSRGSSLPEVCGPEADYFDPTNTSSIAESLLRLGTRAGDTPSDRARRRAWARQFSWDECAARTTELLQQAGRC